MSVRYTRITEEEFDDVIGGISPAAEVAGDPRFGEKVYDLPLPRDELTVRVFSTIETGAARDRGDDAIRCVVWNHDRDVPVGGRRKTLRIAPTASNPEGWAGTLREKVEDLYRNWRDHAHGLCPECGAGVLQEREPGPGDDWPAFLACSEWDGGDGCKYTEVL